MGGNATDKKCLLCGEYGIITITDSRADSRKGSMFRRRRHCQTCGETYTTQEVLAARDHLGPDARVMEMNKPEKAELQRCKVCVYIGSISGEYEVPICRFNAPIATGGMMSDVQTIWPIIDPSSDWCGRFEDARPGQG